jgi:hypothetical protein
MTNSTVIHRPRRRPQFSSEALQLFAKLEAVVDQDGQVFKDGSKRLAAVLGLGAEFLCSGAYVNNRALEPPWPDHMPAAQDFWRVRRVREQLLAVINGHNYEPTTNGHTHAQTRQLITRRFTRPPRSMAGWASRTDGDET